MQTLQFGIIGLGHFGKHYARLLQEIPGVNLIAVANKSEEAFKENEGVLDKNIKKSLKPKDIINSKAIDCVVIATPPSTHKDLIIECLRAGKHVLVEKPMVLSSAAAKEVAKELKKSKLSIFMVAFQYVYNDHIRYIKTHLKELGKIQYILGENLYCGPLRADVGSLMDAGVHDLSILEYLFSPGKITEVSGGSRSFDTSSEDDFSAATIKFKSGLIANLVTSRYWPEKVRKITIVGNRGMVVFNDSEGKLKLIKNNYPLWRKNKSSLFLPDVINQPFSAVSVEAREPLRNELEYFIDCVRTGNKPLTGIDFGLKVTEMTEQIGKKIFKL